MLTALLLSVLSGPALIQPINGIPNPQDATEFTFAVLGDNRPAGSGQPPTEVFKRILTEVGWIHPAFVLSTGDLIYGSEESIDAYRQECAWIKPLLAGIGVPFYNAPGNHEINGRPEFQAEYLKQFGKMYGSFDYGGCRFIALATDLVEATAAFTPEEGSWLDSALADHKAAFVFEHRPVFARAVKNPEDGATVAAASTLAAKFTAGNVKAVFCGHDHVFNHQTHDGVEYYISGGAGAPLDASPQEGGFFHYLLVHVKDGKFDVTVMPLGSIDVRQEGDDVRVSSYCDADLQLENLTVVSAKPLLGAKAEYDKKGKMAEAEVSLVSVDKGDKGYTAHLRLALKKHRQTFVHLRS